MKTSDIFQPSPEDIDNLVANYPFSLLVSGVATTLSATPLPLLLERDTNGTITLFGHFARANPHVAELEKQPEALVIFQGPHGYISPSWYHDRTQAPTWNFATVHFSVRVEFLRTTEATRNVVEKLSAAMESGRPQAWNPADMGERYERLLPAIIAFRAHVLETRAKFKLGQNERLDVLEDAIAGLRQTGEITLAEIMGKANAYRR